MGEGGQRHAPAALLRERSRTHCIGCRVGRRDGLDGWGKPRPHRDSFADRPGRSESLYRVHYPRYILIDVCTGRPVDKATVHLCRYKISHCIFLTYSATWNFSARPLADSASWLDGAKECITIFVTGLFLQLRVVTFKLAMTVYCVLLDDYSADPLQVFVPTRMSRFRRVYNMGLQPAAHIMRTEATFVNYVHTIKI
jgi:hypothetical protein